MGSLYLASKHGRGTFWIPAALIATLAIMIVGGIITGWPMARLQKGTLNVGIAFNALSIQTQNRQVALSYGLRGGLALRIVFLMTAKPDVWPSTFALITGCIAGLAVTYGWCWHINRAIKGKNLGNELFIVSNLKDPANIALLPRGTSLCETTYGGGSGGAEDVAAENVRAIHTRANCFLPFLHGILDVRSI